MRRLTLILFLASLAVVSCKKEDGPVISDNPFFIDDVIACGNMASATIIPENNTFNYYYGFISKADFESQYHSDDNTLIKAISDSVKVWSASYGLKVSEFTFKGAWEPLAVSLESETEYYFYAYPYVNDDTPKYQLTKVALKTLKTTPSDIKFALRMHSDTVYVTPTNEDTYYTTFDSWKTVKDTYGLAWVYHYNTVVMMWKYGFIDNLKLKGNNGVCLSDFFYLNEGDSLCFNVSGYDTAINSPISSYNVIYRGKGKEGEVIPYVEM